MNLCIDWGNTRVKAATFEQEKLIEAYNFSQEEALEHIIRIVERSGISNSIISSVTLHPEELVSFLKANTYCIVLDAHTPLPVMNAYSSAETLGADRVALAVAADGRYPAQNTLVISVGTAITYNFVNEKRIFRGGAISPGMRLRFTALHSGTGKLPVVDESGELILLGYDTETGIRSGVMNGIVYEIDGMIAAYALQYPGMKVVLSGGDAGFFADKLKSVIFADSNFLLKGLNLILQHNAR